MSRFFSDLMLYSSSSYCYFT